LFLQFALNRGGSDQAIWVAALFLALRAIGGAYDPRALPRRNLLAIGLFLSLVLVSWAFFSAQTDAVRSLLVIRFAILVLAVHHLAHQQPGLRIGWVAALATAIVLWQFAASHILGHPYGTFSNPHYLAYFSSLLLPVFVFLTGRFHLPYRFFLAVVLALDLVLVFNSLEKPTIPLLANATALASVVWSVSPTRLRWTLFGFALVAAAAMWYGTPDTWVSALGVASPGGDERVRLWSDAWHMILAGDARAWLVGHGLGSFREQFANFTAPQYRWLTLPHNHFLELLYENGLSGALPVMAFLGYLAARSIRLARGLRDPGLRCIAQCNLAALSIWFVFSFLAFGFYSRYTLYPFGILVGLHLYLADRWDAQSRADPTGAAHAEVTSTGTESCNTPASPS
jgi:hypothetical protein